MFSLKVLRALVVVGSLVAVVVLVDHGVSLHQTGVAQHKLLKKFEGSHGTCHVKVAWQGFITISSSRKVPSERLRELSEKMKEIEDSLEGKKLVFYDHDDEHCTTFRVNIKDD